MMEDVTKECCKDKILSYFEGKPSKLTKWFFSHLLIREQNNAINENGLIYFYFWKYTWTWIFFSWNSNDDENFIRSRLGRTTINYHSTSSYHVPFHNMLKWIILAQNLLYNYVKWHLYIWLEPFEFIIIIIICILVACIFWNLFIFCLLEKLDMVFLFFGRTLMTFLFIFICTV